MIRKLRVLVVDDSAIIRRLVGQVIKTDRSLELIGPASSGQEALKMIEDFDPDIVTLDVEMPGMDGLQTLKHIRKRWRRLPVIMLSAHTRLGASATLDALAAGASDYVAKPSGGSLKESLEILGQELLPRVRRLARRRSAQKRATAAAAMPRTARPAPTRDKPAARQEETSPRKSPTLARPPIGSRAPTPRGSLAKRPKAFGPPSAPTKAERPKPVGQRMRQGPIKAVLIGSSTGGPQALGAVLTGIPKLPVPMLIVQHMPTIFTAMLAERLDKQCAFTVKEGKAGEAIVPGTAWIAPGGFHMVPVRRGTQLLLQTNEEAKVNSCRPAVDVTLKHASSIWGANLLVVILTGMGADGCASAEISYRAGATVIAQDEESSVVWGMPGAVVKAGVADVVVPLEQVANEINRRLTAFPSRNRVTSPKSSRF